MNTKFEVTDNHIDENFIMLADSYKLTQWPMYPDNLTNMSSYYESRFGSKYPYTVCFGLQMYLKRYFEGSVVSKSDVIEADGFYKSHFMELDVFNKDMWNYIVNIHGGRLPLKIRCVPEGLAIPINNQLFTVEATDEKCVSLVSPVETILTHFWYPSNVATISRDIRVKFDAAFKKSVDVDSMFLRDFMLHDFGFRGATCVEASGMGGAGHLVNFKGTDTITSITYVKRYYGQNCPDMPGFSVPAGEHSVMCSLGESGELEMFKKILDFYKNGILSLPGDSYNINRFVKTYMAILKKEILNRNGKFVVRPDSPRFVGDKPWDQILWIAETLENIFGSVVNKKGFKELNPKVGILYGDGLSAEEIKTTIDFLVNNGWTATTCVFGMGGGLLQKHNRDTQRSAFKCSAQLRDGVWVPNQKKPLDITKTSKAGLNKLVKVDGGYQTVSRNDQTLPDVFHTVFENGQLVNEIGWTDVRNNALIPIQCE